MRDRQVLWSDIIKDILAFAIEQNASAPGGTLAGIWSYDLDGNRVLSLGTDPETGEEKDRRVEVNFPPMLERDAKERVEAVVSAITLNGFGSAGTFDKQTAVQLLLQALAEDDIDQMLDRLAPEEGTPLLPPAPPVEPASTSARRLASTGQGGSASRGGGVPTAADARANNEAAMVEAVREMRASLQTLLAG